MRDGTGWDPGTDWLLEHRLAVLINVSYVQNFWLNLCVWITCCIMERRVVLFIQPWNVSSCQGFWEKVQIETVSGGEIHEQRVLGEGVKKWNMFHCAQEACCENRPKLGHDGNYDIDDIPHLLINVLIFSRLSSWTRLSSSSTLPSLATWDRNHFSDQKQK